MWKPVFDPFRQEAIVLALGLTLFAVYLPIAAWLHRDLLLPDRPTGLQVERLDEFELDADGSYQARVYGNASHRTAILYDGKVKLEQVDIVSVPPTLRFIRMMPKDGSDPRNNGRHYYLVQP